MEHMVWHVVIPMLMKSDTIASEMWKEKEICVMVRVFKESLRFALVTTSLPYVSHFYLHPLKERCSTSFIKVCVPTLLWYFLLLHAKCFLQLHNPGKNNKSLYTELQNDQLKIFSVLLIEVAVYNISGQTWADIFQIFLAQIMWFSSLCKWDRFWIFFSAKHIWKNWRL